MFNRVSCLVLIVVFIGGHECANTHRRGIDDEWRSELEDILHRIRARNQKIEMKIDSKWIPYNKERIFSKFDENDESDVSSRKSIASPVDPPPVDQPALMGRYIVNQADWTAVATISSRKDIFSFPIANLVSVSDGPLGNGTGVPYMFLTPLDYTAQDLALDDRATLLMSLAEGSYCAGKNMDPMDPRCARIILAGRIEEVTKSSPDYEIAKSAVFGRHPWLAHMPPDHRFFLAKLNIVSIAVLDAFGGPKYVSVEDYMNPPEIHLNGHRSSHGSYYNWEKKNLVVDDESRAVFRV